MMKKNILKSIIFCAILALLLGVCQFLLKPKSEEREFLVENANSNRIQFEGDDSIDVLITGDSLSYRAFIPMEIWNEAGITTYDCGTSGQSLDETYDYLVEILKYQKPKMVILEANCILRGITVEEYTMHKSSMTLPLLRYHDRWKPEEETELVLTENTNLATVFIPTRDVLRGFIYSDVVVPSTNYVNYMERDIKEMSIPEMNKIALKAIADLCEQHGVKLVCISSPSVKCCTYSRDFAIKKLVEEYGIDYYDLNLGRAKAKIGIDWTTDTSDGGDHLNMKGALKVTSYVTEILVNDYQMVDRRTLADSDEANKTICDEWNRDYELYLKNVVR